MCCARVGWEIDGNWITVGKVNVERTLDAPGSLKISVDAWQANRLLPFFTPQNEAGDDVGAGAEKFLSNSMMIPLLLKVHSNEFSFCDFGLGVENFLHSALHLR